MASSSRKYPYPHEVQVSNYVLTKLTQFNHTIWRPMMIELIGANGLIGFIDGTVEPPPAKNNGADNQDYFHWKQSDDLVRRWILQALGDDILPRVANSKTARDLWTTLERRLSHPFNTGPQNVSNEALAGCDLSPYLPLYHAALQSDWAAASEIFDRDPNAASAIITGASETALLIAVRSANRNQFVKKLLDKLLPDDVIAQNVFGSTALHIAAAAGNLEVAKWLVDNNSLAPIVYDKSRSLPIHNAAVSGKRGTVVYFLTVMKPDLTNFTNNPTLMETKPFEGESGLRLIHCLIAGGIYDIALSLLQQYPTLAQAEFSPLNPISLKHSAFLSGDHLSSWQHLIYSCVPIQLEDLGSHHVKGDIENTACCLSVGQKWNAAFWKLAVTLVPQIKHVREKKLIHHQALELVRHICMQIIKLDPEKARVIFGYPLRTAACIGNHEVVEEILFSFPSAFYLKTEMQQSFLHLAIVNRRENVFNLIYQFEDLKHTALSTPDALMNNGMHLVGYMDSDHLVGSSQTPQKLNLRSSAAGAALQMQRELQWFKEVEKLSLPQDREQRNTTGKTAEMIFVDTHEELAREGEQWMKDRANSCTIVAALVATVVFAAAITVPGGNNGGTGIPMFSGQTAFIIFAVSDALALISSTSSMLMFLGIMTSRYALEDFLYSLPKRLIIGLATLFLSLLFMMIAFSATLYLVFGDKKRWVLGLASASAGIPVILFALLQFRPLLDIIKSTYGRGIFRKQSDRILF